MKKQIVLFGKVLAALCCTAVLFSCNLSSKQNTPFTVEVKFTDGTKPLNVSTPLTPVQVPGRAVVTDIFETAKPEKNYTVGTITYSTKMNHLYTDATCTKEITGLITEACEVYIRLIAPFNITVKFSDGNGEVNIEPITGNGEINLDAADVFQQLNMRGTYTDRDKLKTYTVDEYAMYSDEKCKLAVQEVETETTVYFAVSTLPADKKFFGIWRKKVNNINEDLEEKLPQYTITRTKIICGEERYTIIETEIDESNPAVPAIYTHIVRIDALPDMDREEVQKKIDKYTKFEFSQLRGSGSKDTTFKLRKTDTCSENIDTVKSANWSSDEITLVKLNN